MAKIGKWIGGFLGLITAGPLGALAGFVLGAIFDSSVDAVNANGGEAYAQQHVYEGERNTFRFSLLVLASYIIKADGDAFRNECGAQLVEGQLWRGSRGGRREHLAETLRAAEATWC